MTIYNLTEINDVENVVELFFFPSCFLDTNIFLKIQVLMIKCATYKLTMTKMGSNDVVSRRL